MRFRDNYTTSTRAEPGRITISEEAYAIGELLEKILDELKRGALK